uniref:Triple QxxK/R motif-containing protein n=1 Tax=Caenorhabditis tropicalis TaxID=1561998 RepID=A0A1I7TS08_9PELO
MADDNVSFTDVGDGAPAANPANGGSSAMLDLLGNLNKKDKKKEKKEKKSKNSKSKPKTKKVRKADKYESQNFLFRIEGTIFCAGIIVGIIVLLAFIIGAIVFSTITNGNFIDYMQPLWGATDENKDGSGID